MKSNLSVDNYKGFVLGLDDVIYPEKDYLLQVYYLFAQFMEYNEQMDGNAIISWMKDSYEKDGPENLFELTAAKFGIPQTYLKNYGLLHQTARLPLKLMLFKKVLDFMQEVHAAGKPLFLLLQGDPVMQLNKVRQMEWHGLETYLKVYFSADTAHGTIPETLALIKADHGLQADELLCVVSENEVVDDNHQAEINFLPTSKL